MLIQNAKKENGLKQASVYATIMERNASGIDTQIVDTDKFLGPKNVFATLLAAGGKTRKKNAWILRMQVSASEDNSWQMFEEICLNALDLKTHIRINLDTVLVTMDSVNGTIGRSKES